VKDFIIADVAFVLAASKNRQYRENTLSLYSTLAYFLQENGLSTHVLLPGKQAPSPGFKIMRSEITDEGFEFLRCALDKWFKGVMAGKWSPTDDSFLKKELERLRRANK
jgi:hypothetical protein